MAQNEPTQKNTMEDHILAYMNLIHEQNSVWNAIPSHYYSDYNVKRGLRNADGTGVLAGLTTIGEVHGYVIDEGNKAPVEGKLRYRGIDVSDIVENCRLEHRSGFEETAFLLLFGFLPDRKTLQDFSRVLAGRRELPHEFTEDMIFKAPSKNIMNKLGRAVLALYSYDDNPDDTSLANLLRQSFDLIARFPILIANAYSCKRHYFDGESLVLHNPNKDLSVAENFLYMIRPNNKYTPLEAEILDLALILQAEHGGGNNSAFTVHVLSSTGTDTYSAISAAVGSLKGPKHGGANAKMLAQMTEIKKNVKDWTDENEVLAYLKKILRKEAGDGRGLIYGMGHAVYTISDPRTVILKDRAKELADVTGNAKEFQLYDLVQRLAPRAFREEKGLEKEICANVDFYSGFVFQMMGLPEDLYTLNIPSARKAYQKQLDGLNALPTLTADQAALQRLAVYQLDRLDRIEAAMAEMTSKDMQVCVSGMPLTQEYITTAKQNADPKAVCAMNNVDLIVAGGYCGGQWRIPGVGALYVPELGWFPEDSQVQGLNFFGGIWQYVSPGLGKGLIYPWWMSFRLFNSPAVTTITLSKNIS